MTPSLLISIPTLGRPERCVETARSARATAPHARILFSCSPGDDETIEACRSTGEEVVVVPWEQPCRADWARKHNRAYDLMSEDWILLAASDLLFHDGWFEACLRAASRHPFGACVVGTNDLGNRRVLSGVHSTHPLVHRDYLACGGVIDDPTRILPEVYGHWYCNPPEAPIWMADCSFTPLGEIEVGDRVIGWEYNAAARPTVGSPRRSLCFADVLSVQRRHAELVRVVMESGREFRCTPDHRWLNAWWTPALLDKQPDRQWVTPHPGALLLHVADEPKPIPAGLEREAGWLAGIYDGEGSGLIVAAQSHLRNEEIVDRVRHVCEMLEIPVTEKRYSQQQHHGMTYFNLQGGRQGYLDFLLRVEPTKRAKLEELIVGWRARGRSRLRGEKIGARRFGRRDRIVSVHPDGEGEVVSMTTSSGNYIAHGYASRNCDDEFVQTAQIRGTYAHAHDAIVEHLHPAWSKADDDETYRIGQATIQEDGALFEERRRLWDPRRMPRRGVRS
jgi:hypothetical protein